MVSKVLLRQKKHSSPEINNSLLVAGAHIASHTVAILMHLMEIVAATQSNSVHEQMLHTSSHAPTISKSKSGITNLSCLDIGIYRGLATSGSSSPVARIGKQTSQGWGWRCGHGHISVGEDSINTWENTLTLVAIRYLKSR